MSWGERVCKYQTSTPSEKNEENETLKKEVHEIFSNIKYKRQTVGKVHHITRQKHLRDGRRQKQSRVSYLGRKQHTYL